MTNLLNYTITSNYGEKRQYTVNGIQYNDVHDGVDFALPQGTPVTLPPGGEWDGVVIVAQLDQYGGAWVDIQAHDGGVTRFLHLSRIDVKVGDTVVSNQQIGLSGGQSGTWGAGLSTGAHLHVGLFVNNRAVDPLSWLQKAYTVSNNNVLSMEEKTQLTNYRVAKEKVLTDTRFAQLGQDEQNAFGSWDGDDNEAPDMQFLLARIIGLREALQTAEKEKLADMQRISELSKIIESKSLETTTQQAQTFSLDKFITGASKNGALYGVIGGIVSSGIMALTVAYPEYSEALTLLSSVLAGAGLIGGVSNGIRNVNK